MPGTINRPVAAQGVIAFQDREDPELFVYFPSDTRAVLGDTIESFACEYFGIGPIPQWLVIDGEKRNVAGGNVHGTGSFDATRDQLKAVARTARTKYKVKSPQFVPARLTNVRATPVFSHGIAALGGGGQSSFPTSIGVGDTFQFSIDSGNSLFPQLIASCNKGKPRISSEIGLAIVGDFEVYGEPFVVRIKTDLTEVWHYVRSRVDIKGNYGWHNLGPRFDEIARGLQEENIIEAIYLKGGPDPEFGLQLLQVTRVVFEAINERVKTGSGLLRFDPNLDPREPKESGRSWLASLAPYSVGVNMSFLSHCFPDTLLFDQTISYQGQYKIEVRASLNLGVMCGPQTRDLFYDATLDEHGCITKKKAEEFQKRIAREVAAKEEQIEIWEKKLIDGEISLQTYEELLAELNDRMLTEWPAERARPSADVVREVEEIVAERLSVSF